MMHTPHLMHTLMHTPVIDTGLCTGVTDMGLRVAGGQCEDGGFKRGQAACRGIQLHQ